MEIHDTDPTPPPNVDPWDEVSANFGELGHHLKSTYRKVADESGPADDAIKDAFATLIGAWDQVASSVTGALQDPETRQHLKKAATSLAAALGSTLTDLSAEFGKNKADAEEE